MDYQLLPGASLTVTCQAAATTPPVAGIPFASEFRLPLKNLDKPWYEATRRYGPYNYHPDRCEDWNLESGGNSDLGEPLVAPFSGLVLAASDWGGGTGKVVQILGLKSSGELIVWAGHHLEGMTVTAGQIITAGEDIGSIGNAGGRYAGAHLHEQICIVGRWGIPSPATFASDSRYVWQQPSLFYIAHGVSSMLIERVTNFDGG